MPSITYSIFKLTKYIIANLNNNNIYNKQLFTIKIKTKIYI